MMGDISFIRGTPESTVVERHMQFCHATLSKSRKFSNPLESATIITRSVCKPPVLDPQEEWTLPSVQPEHLLDGGLASGN